MAHLVFDAADWVRTGFATWTTDDGDAISVDSFDVPPDLPFPLDEVRLLRHAVATSTAERGATLVDFEIVTLARLPAIRQVSKTALPDGSGLAVSGAFTVPRATCSAILKVQCLELRPTGLREAQLLQRHLSDRTEVTNDAAMAEWNTGSLDPLPRGPLPRHPCDEPEFDLRYPLHPLSRARALMRELAGIVTATGPLPSSPPFGAPPPPRPSQAPRRGWFRPFR